MGRRKDLGRSRSAGRGRVQEDAAYAWVQEEAEWKKGCRKKLGRNKGAGDICARARTQEGAVQDLGCSRSLSAGMSLAETTEQERAKQ